MKKILVKNLKCRLDKIHLKDLFIIIWRKRVFLLGSIVVGAICAYLSIAIKPPKSEIHLRFAKMRRDDRIVRYIPNQVQLTELETLLNSSSSLRRLHDDMIRLLRSNSTSLAVLMETSSTYWKISTSQPWDSRAFDIKLAGPIDVAPGKEADKVGTLLFRHVNEEIEISNFVSSLNKDAITFKYQSQDQPHTEVDSLFSIYAKTYFERTKNVPIYDLAVNTELKNSFEECFLNRRSLDIRNGGITYFHLVDGDQLSSATYDEKMAGSQLYRKLAIILIFGAWAVIIAVLYENCRRHDNRTSE